MYNVVHRTPEAAMTDTQSLKDDLAFLRDLTQDGGKGLARDGFNLAAVGLVFGVVTLVYWLVFWGPLANLAVLTYWLWVAGILLMIVSTMVARRSLPAATGAAARALSVAWNGVGVSLLAGGLALLAAGWRLRDATFVLATFPILLFSLYGAAWGVAFAVKRLTWFAWVSAGCFAAAIAEGLLYRSPHQWLVLSIGLFLMVGLPGLMILNKARAQKASV
jgi:Na+/H+-translocating membrane pyrophosphatase